LTFLLAGCSNELSTETIPTDSSDLAAKCKPFMDQAAEIVNKACNEKLAAVSGPSDFELKQKCIVLESTLPSSYYTINDDPTRPDYILDSLNYSKKLKTCVASYTVLGKQLVGSIEDTYTFYYDAINKKPLSFGFDRTKENMDLTSEEILKYNKIISEKYEKEIELLK
jgi:hypothetical protein